MAEGARGRRLRSAHAWGWLRTARRFVLAVNKTTIAHITATSLALRRQRGRVQQ